MRTAVQTAFLMTVLTMGSKCFGFIREMVMANYFGTSYITDAYVMAVAVPGIIFGGVLSAVSVAYMPIFSKIIEQDGEDEAYSFTSGVLNILAIVAIAAALIGIILSDQIVSIFASGFKGETASLTSYFLKITFIYIIFFAISEILESFLRYKGVFIPQVAFGFIQNIILITTIIISALTSYYYLVVGYFLVYIARLLIMIFIARKKKFKYKLDFKVSNTVKKIIALSVPVFIGSGMNQINAFVDKTLASGLAVGSVSALNYGNLLITIIMGLTVSIMTTIIYPKLTQSSALGDIDRLNYIVITGSTLIAIITIPFTLGSMIYNKQIVQIIFEHGEFDTFATDMTSSAFFYYVIGLLFISLNSMFYQLYYAQHNTKSPVIFGAIGVIINVVLNLLLVQSMGHSGLALATSISAFCGTIMMIKGLKNKYPQINVIPTPKKLNKIIASSFISIFISYIVYKVTFIYINTMTFAKEIQLIFAIIMACLTYIILLFLFKVEEVKIINQLFRRYKIR